MEPLYYIVYGNTVWLIVLLANISILFILTSYEWNFSKIHGLFLCVIKIILFRNDINAIITNNIIQYLVIKKSPF